MPIPATNNITGFTTAGYVQAAVYKDGDGNIIDFSLDMGMYLTEAEAALIYQPLVANVSSVEIGYLDGVTSAIQTQLNAKADTSALSSYLTTATAASTYLPLAGGTLTGALTLNAAGIIAGAATISATEVSYLDGVTSAIQTQIDAKLATATAASTYLPLVGGTITGNGAASTPAIRLTGTIFSSGDATTTKALLLIEPTGTASTAWSTKGTFLGVNAGAAFDGNLIDLQVAASSKFKVTYNGAATFAAGVSATTGLFQPTANGTEVVRVLQTNGSRSVAIGTLPSLANYPTLWMTSSVPSITNYTLTTDGSTETILNIPSGSYLSLRVANSATLFKINEADGFVFTPVTSNKVVIRNSTNAQTLQVHGSYTDASTYSRASLSCSTTALTLAFESNTGNGNIVLTPKGTGGVGIGTTSPGSFLDIAGASGIVGNNSTFIRILDGNGYSDISLSTIGAAGNIKVAYIGGGNNVTLNGGSYGGQATITMNSGDVANVVFSASGTNYINSGNVGIGTTTPTDKLQVNGGITATTGTFSTSVTVGSAGNKWIQHASVSSWMQAVNSAGVANVAITAQVLVGDAYVATNQIKTYNSENLLYLSTNKVEQYNGLVAQTFQVYGSRLDSGTYSRASLTCSTTALTLAFESNTGNGDVILTPKGTGGVGIGMTPTNMLSIAVPSGASGDTTFAGGVTTAINSYRVFQFGIMTSGDDTNLRSAVEFRTIVSGTGGSDSEIGFWTNQKTISRAERMTITRTGNVGIGTTGPVAPLQVIGKVLLGSYPTNSDAWHEFSSGAGFAVTTNSYSDRYLWYANSGNFEVINPEGVGTSKYFRMGAGYSQLGLLAGGSPMNLMCDNGANSNIFFQTKDTLDAVPITRMTVLSAGNVGIGITAPLQKLEVAGNAVLRNSTTATYLHVHGTYTDASTYVRAALSCSTTAVTLAAESAGGGADLNINLTPKGTGYISVLNSTNYTNIKKDSGASSRLHIMRPDSTTDSAVSFGGGNAEIFIRGTLGQITHSGATFAIIAKSSSDMQITVESSAQLLIGNSAGNLAFGSTGACAFSKAIGLASYTVAGVPAATTAGQIIYVSNESGGAVPAFSDGTNWRRVTDRAIVS